MRPKNCACFSQLHVSHKAVTVIWYSVQNIVVIHYLVGPFTTLYIQECNFRDVEYYQERERERMYVCMCIHLIMFTE